MHTLNHASLTHSHVICNNVGMKEHDWFANEAAVLLLVAHAHTHTYSHILSLLTFTLSQT